MADITTQNLSPATAPTQDSPTDVRRNSVIASGTTAEGSMTDLSTRSATSSTIIGPTTTNYEDDTEATPLLLTRPNDPTPSLLHPTIQSYLSTLLAKNNPIPYWYRFFLGFFEPLTTIIAIPQVLFFPNAYLAETIPGSLQEYNQNHSIFASLFMQVALCFLLSVYIELYLFGIEWINSPPQKWDLAVKFLLVGDIMWAVALFQGNRWTAPSDWTHFSGANALALHTTEVLGIIGPATRIAFLLRVGFQHRATRLARRAANTHEE
ncbi:unnamed protein product [Sympodiomycopsis kandeliae]